MLRKAEPRMLSVCFVTKTSVDAALPEQLHIPKGVLSWANLKQSYTNMYCDQQKRWWQVWCIQKCTENSRLKNMWGRTKHGGKKEGTETDGQILQISNQTIIWITCNSIKIRFQRNGLNICIFLFWEQHYLQCCWFIQFCMHLGSSLTKHTSQLRYCSSKKKFGATGHLWTLGHHLFAYMYTAQWGPSCQGAPFGQRS